MKMFVKMLLLVSSSLFTTNLSSHGSSAMALDFVRETYMSMGARTLLQLPIVQPCKTCRGGPVSLQIPSSLSAPTLSSVKSQLRGPIYDSYGHLMTNVSKCGAYRFVTSDLLDQFGNPIYAKFTLTTLFYNYSATSLSLIRPPTYKSSQDTTVQRVSDTQIVSRQAPVCPGPDDHEQFDQSFTVQLNGKTYPLTTVWQVQRGYYAGAPDISVKIIER